MTTFTKTFRFVRLPSPRLAPETWREYLTDSWADMSPRWARRPVESTAELRTALDRDLPELLPDWDALASVLGKWDLGRLARGRDLTGGGRPW